MTNSRPPRIGLLWSQFAAYHIDRCEAVARRLESRAAVLAVEVASASQTYAWDASGDTTHARKLTLFPGQSYEALAWPRRLWAQWRALAGCRMVCIGIGSNQPDVIALIWLLWLGGTRVVLMNESKFDDYRRSLWREVAKAALLAPCSAAIVGGRRHIGFMRFLGFRKRPVLPGYDGVSLDRVRAESGGPPAPDGIPFGDRPFVFVGRFIEKKNLFGLVEAYAAYAGSAGANTRRLVLVGSGPLEEELRARIASLGIDGQVDLPGFQPAEQVSRILGGALALVLVSSVEQWGLVVNEALALGLPAIVSDAVGARDALVRNLVNGIVVEAGAASSLALAMARLAGDEHQWRRMVAASHKRAWMGDTERLADAVELLVGARADSARQRIELFLQELGTEPERGQA